VWLSGRGGRLPVVWPAGFHARLHPLELLDSQGAVVAKGGDRIAAGGGDAIAKADGKCMLGQKSAFYVMSNVSLIARH
jgi:hypothetical protein